MYQKKYYIGSNDVDQFLDLKLPSFFKLMQDIATEHAEVLDIGKYCLKHCLDFIFLLSDQIYFCILPVFLLFIFKEFLLYLWQFGVVIFLKSIFLSINGLNGFLDFF